MRRKQKAATDSFESKYPNLATWVLGDGWVEIGKTEWTHSFVRALDLGGMVWEGKRKYKTIDEALQALDAGIKAWTDENG